MINLDSLLNPVLWGLISFPLLMVVALAVALLKKPAKRVTESDGAVGSAVRKAQAAGPKEGWSGYIIGAVTLAIILSLSFYVFSQIDSAQKEAEARTPASSMSGTDTFIGADGRVWGSYYPNDEGEMTEPDMLRTKNDEGVTGYISVDEMYAAQKAAFAELDGPGTIQREIPLYDESGEVIGSYTVTVRGA